MYSALRRNSGAPTAAGLAGLSIGCGMAFAAVTGDVLGHGPVSAWDRPVHAWFLRHRSGPVTVLMEAMTWLGSTAVLIPLLIAVGGYLAWSRRDVRTTLFVWAAFAGSVILSQLGKVLTARPRPPAADMITHAGGYAFPSGHSIQAMTGWGLLAILSVTSGALRRRTRATLAWTCVAIIVLVGLSRLYLGVHWLSDVIGGFLLGAAWLALLLALRRRNGPLGPARPRAIVVFEDDQAWEDADGP